MLTVKTAIPIGAAIVREYVSNMEVPIGRRHVDEAVLLLDNARRTHGSNDTNYLVFGQNTAKEEIAGLYKCTCRDFNKRRTLCVHILACMVWHQADKLVDQVVDNGAHILSQLFEIAASETILGRSGSVSLYIDLSTTMHQLSMVASMGRGPGNSIFVHGNDLVAMVEELGDKIIEKVQSEPVGVIGYPLDTHLYGDTRDQDRVIEHVAPELDREIDGD